MLKYVYIISQRRTEEDALKKFVPVYEGELRKHSLQVPRCISECSGIRVFGRRIKSLVFSTDVAIIKNINADAVIAVYPFTPQPTIAAGANAITYTPPTSAELFAESMAKYRSRYDLPQEEN